MHKQFKAVLQLITVQDLEDDIGEVEKHNQIFKLSCEIRWSVRMNIKSLLFVNREQIMVNSENVGSIPHVRSAVSFCQPVKTLITRLSP